MSAAPDTLMAITSFHACRDATRSVYQEKMRQALRSHDPRDYEEASLWRARLDPLDLLATINRVSRWR